MPLYCGKREFKTWEEASVFIEEFKQREKERKEKAFYCWHNIPIDLIMKMCIDAGILLANDTKEAEFNGETIILNLSNEAYREMVIEEMTKKLLNDILSPIINKRLSQELHAGPRLPLISFDSPQEETEEVTVN